MPSFVPPRQEDTKRRRSALPGGSAPPLVTQQGRACCALPAAGTKAEQDGILHHGGVPLLGEYLDIGAPARSYLRRLFTHLLDHPRGVGAEGCREEHIHIDDLLIRQEVDHL